MPTDEDQPHPPPEDADTLLTGTSENNDRPSPVPPPPVAVPSDGSQLFAPDAAPAPVKSRHKLSVLLIAVIAVLILGVGSAGAYFGLVVPKKPENVLKNAIGNTLRQHQVTTDGSIKIELPTTGASTLGSVNSTFKIQTDSDKKASSLAIEITTTGLKLPLEIRLVDKAFYARIGNLSSLGGFIKMARPAYAPIVDQISQKISDQWIEVDASLLKAAKLDCVIDANGPLSEADISKVMNAYKDNPFAKVKSTASDTVNGKAATRFNLQIDASKTNGFANRLQDLAALKKLMACFDSASLPTTSSSSELDKDLEGTNYEFNLWVDKTSKVINQAEVTIKQGQSVTVKFNFSYGALNIAKPDGAKSLLEVLGGLSSIIPGSTSLGGLDTLGSFKAQSTAAKVQDVERQTDIKAAQAQLETYHAQNGKYPTLAQLNSAAFRAANLKGLDEAALKDPEGLTSTLAAAPTKSAYAYAATGTSGTTCDNVTTDCTKYTLTATLSDGFIYTKQNIN